MAAGTQRAPRSITTTRWQSTRLDDVLAGADALGGSSSPVTTIVCRAGAPATEGRNYFNARYYDPTTGRFLTEDPSRQGSNWYAYCGNNPINRVDLTGRYDVDDTSRGANQQQRQQERQSGGGSGDDPGRSSRGQPQTPAPRPGARDAGAALGLGRPFQVPTGVVKQWNQDIIDAEKRLPGLEGELDAAKSGLVDLRRQVALDVTNIAMGGAAAALNYVMQGKTKEALSQALGEMAAEGERSFADLASMPRNFGETNAAIALTESKMGAVREIINMRKSQLAGQIGNLEW